MAVTDYQRKVAKLAGSGAVPLCDWALPEGGRVIQRDWEGEWAEIVLQKQQAIERSQQFQAEVMSLLRRRRPPPMQLLRDADRAAADLARIKSREESFLREWRSAHGMQSA